MATATDSNLVDHVAEPVSAKPQKAGLHLDLSTLLGIAIALGGIIGGLILEKGTLQDLTQFTAALIVFGGTLGAVLVSNPMASVVGAARRVRSVLVAREPAFEDVLDMIVQCSAKARRTGIVSLEDQAAKLQDPCLRKGVELAVDGVDTAQIRETLELDLRLAEDTAERDAKVFEQAGGYAPTIGILGAVMGLIQVMKHLENIAEVGRGIAVAFVATIYGVGVANLVLLPIAAKIRAHCALEMRLREMVVEGVVCIAEGLNPRLIHRKLESFLPEQPAAAKAEKGPQPALRNAAAKVAEG
jgi:chemotaxis protein MotA